MPTLRWTRGASGRRSAAARVSPRGVPIPASAALDSYRLVAIDGEVLMYLGKANRYWLFLLAGLVMVGCAANSDMAEVTGVVNVDGQPAEKGSISFFPLNGQGPTTGAQIVQGKYQAKVPLGESKVEIRVSKAVGQKKLYDTPDSPVQEVYAEVLPSKYNSKSELRLDAQPGVNEKDWNLDSQ